MFSHDVWDQDINDLVRAINFTRVVQIYYPHSLQTHPDTFPGHSPADCVKDWSRDRSVSGGDEREVILSHLWRK